MTKTHVVTLICAGALGVGASLGLAACGEDRGGVEVQGGTAGATTAGATTPTTPTTTTP